MTPDHRAGSWRIGDVMLILRPRASQLWCDLVVRLTLISAQRDPEPSISADVEVVVVSTVPMCSVLVQLGRSVLLAFPAWP